MSMLLKSVFEQYGIPYLDEYQLDNQTEIPAIGYESCSLNYEKSATSWLLKGHDESCYLGDFTLEQNTDGLPEAITERSKEISSILTPLYARIDDIIQQESYYKSKYRDLDIVGLNSILEPLLEKKKYLKMVIDKAQSKQLMTYQQYREPFTKSFRNIINQNIKEHEANRKKEEQDHYNSQRSMGYKTYDIQGLPDSSHTKAIQSYQAELANYDRFVEENEESHEGYFSFLKKNLPENDYAFFLRSLRARVPLSERAKHSYVVAKTGSGKTELLKLLMYNEIQSLKKPTCSIVLIDPAGDIADQVARFPEFSTKEGRERLVFIDPLIKSGYTPSINPFELKDKSEDNIALMTQELINVLGVILSESGKPTLQMTAILSPCISVLLRREGSSFRDLQRFMDDTKNEDLIKLGLKAPHEPHRTFFEGKFSSDTYTATKNGIYTRIQVLVNDPTFERLISDKTTVDLERLIQEKKIILFRLPLGEVGTTSVQTYGRFIVSMLRVIALKRSPIPERKRDITHLYIDEFQNFVSEDVGVALTQLRKMCLYLTLAHQHVGQGDIDTSLQKALFGVGVKITGQNEAKSLSAAETEIDVPIKQLKTLRKGEFYIKTSDHPAYRVKAPTFLLKNSHSMATADWKEIKSMNIERYYRRINEPSIEEAAAQDLSDEIKRDDQLKDISQPNNLKPKYDN